MMEISVAGTIIYLLGNLFRMYIINCFLNVFFLNNRHKNIRVLCYGLLYFITSLTFLCLDLEPSITVVINLIGVILVALTYEGQNKYKVFSAILITAFNIACEDCIFFLLVKLDVKWLVIVGVITTNIFVYMVVSVLKKVVERKNGKEVYSMEWGIITFVPLCSILMSTLVLDNCVKEPIIAFGCISLALINVLVFYLFDRLHSMYNLNLEVALLEQQNRAYNHEIQIAKLSNDRIKQLYHDVKNHIFALEHLAKEAQNKELIRYLENLTDSLIPKYEYLTTGNKLLDGFINIKLSEAESYGANIETDISISNNVAIEPNDISVLIGNLMDNAIYALKKQYDSKEIYIQMKEEPGILMIHIKNTHCEDIDFKKGNYFSTKGNKQEHGIGLKNVYRVVEKYHGSIELKHDNKIFSARIVLFTEM